MMKTDMADKQQKQKQHWVTHPTRRNLLMVVIVWIVANGLLVIAITDLFRESVINKKYTLIYAMMLFSTWITVNVISNYFKTNVTDSKK